MAANLRSAQVTELERYVCEHCGRTYTDSEYCLRQSVCECNRLIVRDQLPLPERSFFPLSKTRTKARGKIVQSERASPPSPVPPVRRRHSVKGPDCYSAAFEVRHGHSVQGSATSSASETTKVPSSPDSTGQRRRLVENAALATSGSSNPELTPKRRRVVQKTPEFNTQLLETPLPKQLRTSAVVGTSSSSSQKGKSSEASRLRCREKWSAAEAHDAVEPGDKAGSKRPRFERSLRHANSAGA